MLILEQIKRTDPKILKNMSIHYSKPKGFVGRNICYAIYWQTETQVLENHIGEQNVTTPIVSKIYYGSIVGGSATMNLPGRNEFFNFEKSNSENLNQVINNIFFHVEKIETQNGPKYPVRYFTSKILKLFRSQIQIDWKNKYNNSVIGFESLVELPRTGECYKQDDWILVGQTKGFTCKRGPGKDKNEKFSGTRVWDYENLRPKLVFCKKV